MYILLIIVHFIAFPMFNVKYLNAQSTTAYWRNKQVIVWFCISRAIIQSLKLVLYLHELPSAYCGPVENLRPLKRLVQVHVY